LNVGRLHREIDLGLRERLFMSVAGRQLKTGYGSQRERGQDVFQFLTNLMHLLIGHSRLLLCIDD